MQLIVILFTGSDLPITFLDDATGLTSTIEVWRHGKRMLKQGYGTFTWQNKSIQYRVHSDCQQNSSRGNTEKFQLMQKGCKYA
jgi:hypothetical protein